MSASLLNALDLPMTLRELQDSYWKAEREWEKLRAAYERVLADMLRRVEADES